MEYLAHWRMMLAGDRLKNADDLVPVLALTLGGESESVFKKVMSCSPREMGGNSYLLVGL
jgi:hypothetical protein